MPGDCVKAYAECGLGLNVHGMNFMPFQFNAMMVDTPHGRPPIQAVSCHMHDSRPAVAQELGWLHLASGKALQGLERCQAGELLARDGGIQEIAGDVAGQTEGMGA